MTLFEIVDGNLVAQSVRDFSFLGIRERQDLQAYLFRRIDVLGDDLMVVSQEYGSWEDARRRLDLLAIDRDGRLVVIELKRTNDGGHADLQALRYAAMIASMTFEDVVAAYAATLATTAGRDLPASGNEPRQDLITFLGHGETETPVLSEEVRIIIVAADFGRELTTAVLWLNRLEGMDIRCVRLRPYQVDGHLILDVDQIIPLKEAGDYQVRMRRKEAIVRTERIQNRDWTRYIVTVRGQRSEPLAKRWAVLALAKAAHAAGVGADKIRSAVTGARFLPVDGTLSGSDLQEQFVIKYPNSAAALDRWFLDDPIFDDGQTWVMSNQWGGKFARETMEAIAALAPSEEGITYEPE